jgi:hypothetical protein
MPVLDAWLLCDLDGAWASACFRSNQFSAAFHNRWTAGVKAIWDSIEVKPDGSAPIGTNALGTWLLEVSTRH